MTFNALYGVFDVGYQQSRVWGTCAFCDDYDSDAGIHYRYMMGPWTFGLEYEKRADTGFSGEGSGQGGTYLRAPTMTTTSITSTVSIAGPRARRDSATSSTAMQQRQAYRRGAAPPCPGTGQH